MKEILILSELLLVNKLVNILSKYKYSYVRLLRRGVNDCRTSSVWEC